MNFEQLHPESRQIIEHYRAVLKKWLKPDLSNVVYCDRLGNFTYGIERKLHMENGLKHHQYDVEAIYPNSLTRGHFNHVISGQYESHPDGDKILTMWKGKLYDIDDYGINFLDLRTLVHGLIDIHLEPGSELDDEIFEFLEERNFLVPVPEKYTYPNIWGGRFIAI